MMSDNVTKSPKLDYHKQLLKGLNLMRSTGVRPRLLLHVCCAPCASYPLQLLAKYFDVDILYFNPNIYPKSEFTKRYEELERYVRAIYRTKKELAQHIKIIPDHEVLYDQTHQEFSKIIGPFGDEREGGVRCSKCFEFRLKHAMRIADILKYEYVITTITAGSNKNSFVVNEIGMKINNAEFPHLTYLASDFKKDGGDIKTKEICDEHKIYRQHYCGCIFSLKPTLKA